ncbi:MAG: acyl-CoA dehydratase activase [Bacteroidota bacterium]|nr:acyl-CoA dehydratase activase [Bacteroidota bacterium]
MSDYPDFAAFKKYNFTAETSQHKSEVQVEIYTPITADMSDSVYMGIDIGSTSTKLMLAKNGDPIIGLYTYTDGQPLAASKALFEALNQVEKEYNIHFHFLGVGTTGSGRKFIGNLIGSDLIVDEITAHARAAYELNPNTDTIIEIGGQDSKFTLMRGGNVVFSQMNSVCAAGTGSFIEEQAKKLNVELKDYSDLAEGSKSPLSSDRCTVFMERDLNHFMNQGYEVREILASVLHSVRENYLKKVAVESAIGKNICFQGATARNKALVAVFEEKLEKPIFVSPYCHLTGALGLALILSDEQKKISSFRGLGLFKINIPLISEVCTICNNNCRITIADLKTEKVAYGFLCGRDYDTKKFIDNNTSGFDLLKARKKIFRVAPLKLKPKTVIGLPAALHLFDELSFWQDFFKRLELPTITSMQMPDPLVEGKKLAGAEFCSPMYALFGHYKWLESRCDHVFMPVYLEARSKPDKREAHYCYYTQFGPSVVSLISEDIKKKSLLPFIDHSKGEMAVVKSLYSVLKSILGTSSLGKILMAYTLATESFEKQKTKLKVLYTNEISNSEDISVVFLGRPYLILAPQLNKGIPGIFGGMGVKTFYQDMVPYEKMDVQDIDYLLKSFPWHFAARILETARVIAQTKNVYPVFITAFKCAPDSFVLEYFKKLLDQYNKPYLILQTDEHDSNVGYETRIEAGIRSFRNHARNVPKELVNIKPVLKQPVYNINAGKTIFFPNWDDVAGRFVTANLRRAGFDVLLLESSVLSVKKSMVHNTGQCLPLNVIVQDYIEYLEKHELDPAKTMLWMTESHLSCNIRMYPQYMQSILDNYGNGMEKGSVYSGELSHLEISINTSYYANFAYMIGGLLRRLTYRLRPYEIIPGETNLALQASIEILEKSFEGNYSIETGLKKSMELFRMIAIKDEEKPKVAVFGDFFVRDNDVMNQNLVLTIEEAGGEVINTPYNDYVKITAENIIRRRIVEGLILEAIGIRSLSKGVKFLENRYYKYFEEFLGPQKHINAVKLEKNLKKYNIKPLHSGESYDNILKIHHVIDKYPDVALLIQTNPAFCCPSLITEAMKDEIKKQTGIPIVTLTYDGTSELKNDVIAPYLKNFVKKRKGIEIS